MSAPILVSGVQAANIHLHLQAWRAIGCGAPSPESSDLRAVLILALLMLAACEKKPPAPPERREAPPPARPLRNFEKAIAKMQRAAPTRQDIARARRTMPNLIARAETRTLRNADSDGSCAAWDDVAANAMQQNDPALVHLWGTLADRRCAQFGRQARYWAEP